MNRTDTPDPGKSIFFVGTHGSLDYSFLYMLSQRDWKVYVPNPQFAREIMRHRRTDRTMGVQSPESLMHAIVVSQDEFLTTRMDVVLLMSNEQERSRWWPLVARAQPRAAIVHFSGNEGCRYRRDRICNLISADTTTHSITKPYRHQPLLPVLPFADFPPRDKSDVQRAESFVGSYIALLENARHEWKMFTSLKGELSRKGGIPLINYSRLTRPECNLMRRRSLLTVHFKWKEGYGFGVLESLAAGVPVIVNRSLVNRGVTLSKFCKEGKGSWIVDTAEEAAAIVLRADRDRKYLASQSVAAAEWVRKCIDEDEQITMLDNFLRSSMIGGRVFRRFGYMPWGWLDIGQERMLAKIK